MSNSTTSSVTNSCIWDHFDIDNGWYSGEDGDGRINWNHWSAALGYLIIKLGRKLTDLEMTEFSLSLGFGHLPLLDREQAVATISIIWPNGNPLGNAADHFTVKAAMDKINYDRSMVEITMDSYNELAANGQIINQPVADNSAVVLDTILHEEDDVRIFRFQNAIALRWGGSGQLCVAYVK